MAWTAGVFSRTNGTHTGTTVWAQDAALGTKITAALHDAHDQDLSDGINATVNKDGSNAFTGNADFGSNKLTNVATGTLSTDGITKAQLDARGLGKQTLFIPAAAMRPTVSNGCAALADAETTAGRPDISYLAFDASSDEHAQFQVAMPKMYNLGTVTFQVFWSTTATDTDGVAWGLQGVAVSDNGTIDVAYGTAVVVTDDAQGATEELLVTSASSAVTIAGTPADDDMCFFRIFRDVSDANDDMTEDARLLGIKLFWTNDAATDD